MLKMPWKEVGRSGEWGGVVMGLGFRFSVCRDAAVTCGETSGYPFSFPLRNRPMIFTALLSFVDVSSML